MKMTPAMIERGPIGTFTSSQAKSTKSTLFFRHVRRNEVDLVPLACEDGTFTDFACFFDLKSIIFKISFLRKKIF